MATRDINVGSGDNLFTFRDGTGAVIFQIAAPAATASLPTPTTEGVLGYDLTLSKLVVWTGAAWEAVTSA
jgi:hypothetical protein